MLNYAVCFVYYFLTVRRTASPDTAKNAVKAETGYLLSPVFGECGIFGLDGRVYLFENDVSKGDVSLLSSVVSTVVSENTSDSSSSTFNNSNLLPDVRNKTIEEAKALLKDSGFKVKITGDEDEATTLIVDQVPKPGVTLLEGSTIYLYTSNNNVRR